MTCLHTISHAWRWLHLFASSSDWFIGLFTTVVIGQVNYYDTHMKTALTHTQPAIP